MNNAAYLNHKKGGLGLLPASPKPLQQSKRVAMNNAAYINHKKKGDPGSCPRPLSRSKKQSEWE